MGKARTAVLPSNKKLSSEGSIQLTVNIVWIVGIVAEFLGQRMFHSPSIGLGIRPTKEKRQSTSQREANDSARAS